MEKQIKDLFRLLERDDQLLAQKVEKYADRWGDRVYSQVLKALVSKDLDADRAKLCWKEALRLDRKLFPELAPGQGLRPALLYYLQRTGGGLRDARIIEGEQLAALQRASLTDGLTGLFNQTYFKAHLEKLICDSQHSPNHPFVVILFDLDRFKQYNDRCGHLAGDEALRQVAETLKRCIRPGDIAARYGGEEFALLLHRVNGPQAYTVAERIRTLVEEATFPLQERLDSRCLTISGGLALYPENGNDGTALLEQADKQLYLAKKNRNLICPRRTSKRQAPRHQVQSMIEFALPDRQTFYSGLTLDIGPTGMAIGCDAEIAPGTILQLRFRRPFWPADQDLRGIVRNLRRESQNSIVRIGLQFEQPTIKAILPLLPTEIQAAAIPRSMVG